MNTYILFAFISQLLILDSVQVVNSDLLKELDTILVYNKEVLEPTNTNLSFYDPISLRPYYKNDTLGFSIRREKSIDSYFLYHPFNKGNYYISFPTEYFVYKERLFVIDYNHRLMNDRAFREKIRKNFFKPATGQTYLIPTTPINFSYGLSRHTTYLKFDNGVLIKKKINN